MGNNNIALQAINQRVWYVEGGVHPTRAPQMLVLGKFSSDPSHSVGEDTKITAPDPKNFNRDVQVGTVAGADERATFSIGSRFTVMIAILLGWANRKCRVDIFALSGKCGNPSDFTEGGEKWAYYPDGRVSAHNFENYAAFGRDENNPTNEMVDMTSETYYEFLYMGQERIASAVTSRQIYTIDAYLGNDCENCPDPTDRILATMAGASATPGTKPVLLYSEDGGENWSQQSITTMFSNEDVVDSAVAGGDLVILSNAGNELHYTDIEMVYDASNSWQQVPTGFVIGKNPNAMSLSDIRHLWIVGNGGYVYFSRNYKTGVEVQDGGIATTNHLRAVHAHNNANVLAVGDSNAVIYTKNGGTSWNAVTGPSVGVNLGACWMWDKDCWFVGEGANGTGKLWLTTNQGRTWSVVAVPATYGRIDKIQFVSEAEGYISARDGSRSYILRTITAGNEWTVMPQGKRAVPVANSNLLDIAVTDKISNTVFAAGLDANGTAGIIVKMAAAPSPN